MSRNTSEILNVSVRMFGSAFAPNPNRLQLTELASLGPTMGFGGVAAHPLFSPTVPPSLGAGHCRIWMNADNITTSAGHVATAPDASGNGNNLIVTGGQEPLYTATNANCNNKQTVDFPAAGTKRLGIPDIGITTGARTVVLVCSAASASNDYIYSTKGGAADAIYNNGSGLNASSDGGTHNNIGSLPVSPSFGVLVAVFNGTGTMALYCTTLTPVTYNAGALQDRTGATGILGNYSGGIATTFSQSGSTRHYMEFSGAANASDAAYWLNGFGAECGITIGP